MAVINSILTNFTAGEISPRVYGRVDLAKYQNGARELTNMTVLPQGGARKRGGTLQVSAVKNNDPDAILVPFVFSTTQAYMLEFGVGYIRFFKDIGIDDIGGIEASTEAWRHSLCSSKPSLGRGRPERLPRSRDCKRRRRRSGEWSGS